MKHARISPEKFGLTLQEINENEGFYYAKNCQRMTSRYNWSTILTCIRATYKASVQVRKLTIAVPCKFLSPKAVAVQLTKFGTFTIYSL